MLGTYWKETQIYEPLGKKIVLSLDRSYNKRVQDLVGFGPYATAVNASEHLVLLLQECTGLLPSLPIFATFAQYSALSAWRL